MSEAYIKQLESWLFYKFKETLRVAVAELEDASYLKWYVKRAEARDKRDY